MMKRRNEVFPVDIVNEIKTEIKDRRGFEGKDCQIVFAYFMQTNNFSIKSKILTRGTKESHYSWYQIKSFFNML